MTDFKIREQIKTIQDATSNALKSKESAMKFLTDAGIIRVKADSKPAKKSK